MSPILYGFLALISACSVAGFFQRANLIRLLTQQAPGAPATAQGPEAHVEHGIRHVEVMESAQLERIEQALALQFEAVANIQKTLSFIITKTRLDQAP